MRESFSYQEIDRKEIHKSLRRAPDHNENVPTMHHILLEYLNTKAIF